MTHAPVFKVNEDGIPQELKVVPQWVLWKLTKEKDKDGNPKDVKKPYRATSKKSYLNLCGDELASTTDPNTWSTYEEVIEDYRTGRFAGIGFVLANGFIGMDWDHIQNAETGEWDFDAIQEIHSMRSYAEISQSGTGVHVIGKGKVPGETGVNKVGGEMYDHGRFFVVTGQHLEGTPTDINDVPKDAIKAMYDRLNPPRTHVSSVDIARTKAELNDEQVLSLCKAARNGDKFEALRNGNLTDYSGDHSAADLALCNLLAFYTQEFEQIDRIFRQSALYRPKWDEKHGKQTYAEMTIRRAIDSLTCTYEPTHGTLTVDEGDDPVNPMALYPDYIIERANQLLDEGNPFNFILDTWNRHHVGDRTFGEVGLCAIASTFIRNSGGLHPKASGGSGGGKSDSAKKLLHLVPSWKIIKGSLSGKSMFYNPNLKKGTIIFTDDVNLNDDIVATIKQATTNYQDITTHNTVKKQEYQQYEIPSRTSWWLTSVDGFDDDQMGNRFIGVDVDTSTEQDQRVFENQRKMFRLGITSEDVDDAVLICRCIFDILAKEEEEYTILFPYSECLTWNNINNRRNFPMFMDILLSVAWYNAHQREKFCGCYLANLDDFKRAKKIYKGLAESNATNLTKDELKVMRWISRYSEVDIAAITKCIGKSETTAKNLMHGRDGQGGLLVKMPGLHSKKVTVKITDKQSTTKNFYWYDDAMGLNSYDDVVNINVESTEEEYRRFKEDYHHYHTDTSLSRQNHNKCDSDKSALLDIINNNTTNTITHYQNDTKTDACECPTKKESIPYSYKSDKNVIVSPDSECQCDSNVIVCDSEKEHPHNHILDSAIELSKPELNISKLHQWCHKWQETFQKSINSSNYVAVVHEYCGINKIPPDQLNDVKSAVMKIFKISDTSKGGL